MKKMLILSALLACGPACFSQQAEKFPLGDYEELTDTKPHDGVEVWNKMTAPVRFCWGTTDVRYKKLDVPDVKATGTLRLKAWKGERVNAQAVLWTQKDLEGAEMTVSELKNGNSVIPASAVRTHFVRYVMTDELNKDGSGGCGARENKAEWDSLMVADVLDIVRVREVKARTTQPVWLNVWVPAEAKPGKYKGTLTVSGKNFEAMKLPFEIEVVNRTLPEPQKWAFHLDLWQNPYAVARYYQVPLWSKAHFDAMRPLMKMLANAGQRAITASIMHKPWAGQTEDAYDSMIFRMKKLDGTWVYDYTVFDKWVEFMMNEVGIKDLISCYTMIPWALSFDYFDQATNRVQFIKAAPGDEAYAEYWGTFLKDFSRHLREKGWFEKTAISMDERPMEAMQEAIKVIKAADPEFKITLAGNYHEEIQGDLYYLSIPYGNQFPVDVKAERERKGQISTVYTCCTEAFPNTFTFSAPAEAAWTALHAVAGGYDGYLRWAVNSWPIDPLRDSRFRTWAAGDTYSIYPGPRSSIRFERLVEGLQDCEKIYVLREELEAKGATGKLKKLNAKLSEFTPEGWIKVNKKSPALMVKEMNALLNEM
ncbi:DUF4091 domain-containing protein [Bacteroides mediterraneensis]|uniref:DUF4091 domain-containing protein n=1 Tax=Phocaeicola sp. TaxID=2773926 RepID=UPI001959484D|nr:DUF4091 domain-containing protein [Bacteroides mediterraneensis]MBU3834279.1 DUF4091 domain-containing protein [Candidatus Phocaeicola merdigallinarum]